MFALCPVEKSHFMMIISKLSAEALCDIRAERADITCKKFKVKPANLSSVHLKQDLQHNGGLQAI